MHALRLMAAGLFLFAVVVGVRAEEKKADNAKLLQGTWEVVKSGEGGPPVGATVEFATGGKLKVTAKKDGKDDTAEGTFALDGNKINVTVKHGDKENKHTVTIKKLTDSEFTGENEKGLVIEFKRKK